MKVLVIGSGGREHAIVRKLRRDEARAGDGRQLAIFAAPGNAGICGMAECAPIGAEDIDALLRFAVTERIDLTIVGPEAPLAQGICDRFAEAGLRVFGPSQSAARIEASKSFARAQMAEAGVPSPAYRVFRELDDAVAYVHALAGPVVVKADGLAAGKGVTVAANADEAERALRAIMAERVFGQAGDEVVIEEFLDGRELSVMAFVDVGGYALMPAIEDHKQVRDGDQGPNTGGMGTYTPAYAATDAVMKAVREDVFDRMTALWRRLGIVYRGVLFAGLMVVDGRPCVIEFNARFGDPETQVALELLDTDLLTVIDAVLADRIGGLALSWSPDAALCVVLAAEGYPEAPRKGDVIAADLIDANASFVYTLHAGTAVDGQGRTVTNGGRVLNVVARGETIAQARTRAYTVADSVVYAGKHYRTDIGARG
ncbi:MAG: phosphoribosylamine--glycine ligase [Bacilli bacterium]